ncbi:hypothetical protein F8388_006664 [Cannabis sativa]|uniref:Transcription factor MYC/MYB N-terminal domain-containing protein n=1 Tax=Cannabis sativa TaxID=3483 RepID=A0A7J6GX63_CANSA|nr:hypothetical protein F8388_006664 [Cannabis sativa]
MANWCQKHEEVPLSKQLAVTVKSIKWSYAIFWSFSTREQGGKSLRLDETLFRVLEWGAGYYNGDIKTKKIVHSMELETNKTGLQRSVQLRELYMSLSEEWYYLVCMSFVFKPGQSLPSTALEKGQPIWLCNAQYADSNVFSRSLLAKSASIQTVVCFPHMGGVIEFGITDLPKGLNDGTSQVQSLNLMDDDFSNGVQGSMNSGDYVLLSGALVKQEKDSKSCFAAWNKRGHGNNYRPILLQEMLKSKFVINAPVEKIKEALDQTSQLPYAHRVLSSHATVERLLFRAENTRLRRVQYYIYGNIFLSAMHRWECDLLSPLCVSLRFTPVYLNSCSESTKNSSWHPFDLSAKPPN